MPIAISAIIPAYNAESYIEQTLQSLLAQTHCPAEIIVVDDGSTDTTASLIEALAARHPAIRHIRQENKGGARARLAGFDAARHDYLYFIDADDVAAPDALERLANGFATMPEAVLCYGPATMVNENLQPLNQTKAGNYRSGQVLAEQLRRNMVMMGSALIQRPFLHRETMDHPLKIGQDLLMWAQLAAAGPFQFIGGPPVLRYRKHGQNVTRRNLEDTSRYFAYIDWIFSYPPILAQLTPEQQRQLRCRRTAAGHSFIAKTALYNQLFALAQEHSREALKLEPFNLRLWALFCFSHLGFLPAFVRKRLF